MCLWGPENNLGVAALSPCGSQVLNAGIRLGGKCPYRLGQLTNLNVNISCCVVAYSFPNVVFLPAIFHIWFVSQNLCSVR